MKTFIIADLKHATDAQPLPGMMLQTHCKPQYVHVDREAAETELLRLAGAYPDGEFFLFECVATTASVKAPVVRMETVIRVEAVTD